MATSLTKVFTATVIFEKNDESTIVASNLQYVDLLALITKKIEEETNASLGEIDAHGTLVVT